MKKVLHLIIITLFLASIGYSQSQRLVLLEHFTQASCGPCATYNPAINTMLNQNPDKFTAIMYHTSWPGFDPMYNHNTPENGARTTYYSVNSVPNSVLDGNLYNGHPNGWNINTVLTRYAVPSPFELSIFHELSADQTVFTATMLIHATEDVPAGMKAQMVTIEKHIHFASPPGSNGETDFYNVMKKMLPNQTGTTLPAFQSGEYMILKYSWEHQNVYDIDELALVGFIQNNDTKEVLQAANSSNVLFSPLYNSDVEVLGVSNIAQSYCTGIMEPKLSIRNNGSDELTSLDISYMVNNGTMNTIQWTGSLGFMDSEEVMLPESNFMVQETNMVEFSVSNPNGVADEYENNNVLNLEIPRAVETTSLVTLVMKLDNHPEETTWEFTNYNGDIIYEGGPYTTPGQQIVQQFSFDATDCYTFTIYDAGGDGLTGGGSFACGSAGEIIAQGNTFGEKAFGQFSVSFTGKEEFSEAENFIIYPNPVDEQATISFMCSAPSQVQMSVYNTIGKVVYHSDLMTYTAGSHNLVLSKNDLNSGIYFVQIQLGEKVFTQKIVMK